MPRIVKSVSNVDEDHVKSFEEWGKLKVEVLKLKCLQYRLISTGKKEQLQHRLVAHFTNINNNNNIQSSSSASPILLPSPIPSSHTAVQVAESSQSNTDPDTDNLTILELRALRSEMSAVKEKQQNQDQQWRTFMESFPSLLEQRNKSPGHSSSVSTILNNNNHNDVSHVNVNASSIPVNQHSSSIMANNTILTPSPSNVLDTSQYDNHNISSNNLNHVDGAVQGFSLPPFMSGNQQVTSGMNNNNSFPSTNPFLPPPLKIKLLKNIEKMEYVDFDDLLPSHPSLTHGGNEQFLAFVDAEKSTTTTTSLSFMQKDKKQKINNISSWMMAWNNFMQASLHYNPSLFYQLFCYQKNMVRLFSKYKFENCYLYDKDFRMLMASQVSVDPTLRSAKWDSLHQELLHMHFQQDTLLPSCFHCKATGHFASYCPSKNKNNFHDQMLRNNQNEFRNASNISRLPNATFNTTYPPNDTTKQRPSGAVSNQLNQGIRTCNRFNKGIFCAKPPCSYLHVCNKCHQGHPGTQCNSVTSSHFMPPSR
jgi:hypothetical protein